MSGSRGWLRRHATLILVLAAAVWILTIVVWITLDPVRSTGDPMD